MTLWERSILSMEKGFNRLKTFSSTLSERVQSEIVIMRLRMQMDDVRRQIDEEHRRIGARMMEQRDGGTLPPSFEVFCLQEAVAAAIERIGQLEKELDGIEAALEREASAIKAPRRSAGEKSA